MNEVLFDEKGNLLRPKKPLHESPGWFENGKQIAPSEAKNIVRGHRYFLCVASIRNYNICVTDNLFGVEPNNKKQIEKTSLGDYIVFYIMKEKEFGMVCRIASEIFEDDTKIWEGGTYKHRVKLERVFDPHEHKKLDEFIRKNLNLFKKTNDKNWGCVLQKSIIEIDEDDFFKILGYLEKR